MATLSEQYKLAKDEGLLHNSVTEEGFVGILKDPAKRKEYYDYVQKHRPGFYSEWDKFNKNADDILAAAEVANNPTVVTKQTGGTEEEIKKALFDLAKQNLAAAKEAQERKKTAVLPVSEDDKKIEADYQAVDKRIKEDELAKAVFAQRGQSPINAISDEELDVLKKTRSDLEKKRVNYLDTPTSFSEAKDFWISAWSKNTDEGKAAYAQIEAVYREYEEQLLKQFKEQDIYKSIFADVQNKFNSGRLSEEDANKELNKRLYDAFIKQYKPLLDQKSNELFNGLAKQALESDNGWLSNQYDTLQRQYTGEAIAEGYDNVNRAIQKDFEAFKQQVGDAPGAGLAISSYIDSQQGSILGTALRLYQKADVVFNATKQGEGGIKDLFGETFKNLGLQMPSIASFGVSDVVDAQFQAGVLKKIADAGAYDNPESVLSENEMILYDAIVASFAADLVRSNDTSYVANAGKITADMIPFVIEIATGRAIFKGLTKSAQRSVSRGILRALGNGKWRRVLARATGEVMEGAVLAGTAAVIAPSTYEKMFQNEIKVDPRSVHATDEGWTVDRIEEQSTGKALWDAYKTNFREIFTETGGMTQFAATFAKASPLAQMIMKSKVGQWANLFENQKIGQLFKQTAYHGIAQEMSEEWENTFYEAVGAFMNAEEGKRIEAFGNIYGEFASPETQVPMLIAFSIPAILGGGASAGSLIVANQQYRSAYNTLRDTFLKYGATQEQFEDALNDFSVSIMDAPLEQYPEIIRSTAAQLSGEDVDLANYLAAALSTYTVADANLGAIQKSHEKKQRLVQQTMHEFYAAEQKIKENTHTNTGIVHHVQMKGTDGQTGYVISGSLEPNQVVTVKMENGEVVQRSSNDFEVISSQPAVEAIEYERRRLTAKMNGMDRFKVGDVIYMTKDGQPIDGSSSRVVGVTDEGVEVEMRDPNGQPTTTVIPHEVAETNLSTSEELVAEGAESMVIETEDGTCYTLQKTNDGDWLQVAPATEIMAIYSAREIDDMINSGKATVVGGNVMEQEAAIDTVETTASEEQVETPQEKSYPVDEEGNPAWEEMNAQQTVDALLQELDGRLDAAVDYATSRAESINASLKELESKKPQATSNLAAYKAELNAIEHEKASLQEMQNIWNETLAILAQENAADVQKSVNIDEKAQGEEQNLQTSAETMQKSANTQENTYEKAQNVNEKTQKGFVLSKTQKTTIDDSDLQAFAEKLGAMGVHVVSSEDQLPKSENKALTAINDGVGIVGWWNPANNQVYIYTPNINSRQKLYSTLLHEFVSHRGLREVLGQKEFNILCGKVWNAMSNEDKLQYSAYIKYQLAVRSNEMSILLDSMSDEEKQALLNDKSNQLAAADEYMAHLAETGVSETERSVWQKICDWVREALRKIGINIEINDNDIANLLRASSKRLSTEGSMRDIADTIYENRDEFNGLEISEDAVIDNNNGQAMFSIVTYEESGREKLRAFLDKRVKEGKLDEADANQIIKEVEEKLEICKKYADKYVPFGKWSYAIVEKDAVGNPIFSVIKSNGEYSMNLDFSLTCKKRRTLDYVFRRMINRGLMDEVVLNEEQIAKINQIIRDHDFETACRLCFVDARRYQVAQVANKFVTMFNKLVNMSDEQLQKQVIDKTKNNTVRKRAAMFLLNNPSERVELKVSDFMDTEGFGQMKKNRPEVMKLYNSAKGQNGPKASYGDVQYLNDILSKEWTFEKAIAVGGVRVQSFSDFVARMTFDYLQMFADMSAKGLPAHAYTKEVDFAKLFGLMGMKINLSLVPAVDANGIAAGLDANGNYVWQEGETFPYDAAIEMQNAEGYRENVGTIAVGVSDAHIRKMLNDPNIRMVIPYHKSGLHPIVAKMGNIAAFTDYTKEQNTRKSNGNAFTKDDKKALAANNNSEPNFNALLQENSDPRKAAQVYLDWCDKNGFIPKFDKWRDHPNYYKLLEDFATIATDANGNEQFVPQGAMKMVLPTEQSAFGSFSSILDGALAEDTALEERRLSEVDNIVDVVEKKVLFSIGNNKQTKQLNAKQEKTGQDIVGEVDDTIRYSISKNNRGIIENWLAKREDLTEQEKNAFFMYIEEEEPMKQLATGKWMANGAIRLPEDQLTVDEAIKFAKKMKVDPLSYAAPAMISNEYRERFGKAEEKAQDQLLSPDDARFEGKLTNKVDYGNGLVVYDVLDNEEGQDAVRELMNDHLGKDFNCWCLLYANAEGKITSQARDTYWQKYNGTQKKVAFYNGKITAFCASEGKTSEWWDLSDRSHKGNIPAYVPMPNDEYNRMVEAEFSEKDGQLEGYGKIFRGNKKNGVYETWYNEDYHSLESREYFKGGKTDGTREGWHKDGSRMYKGTFKEGKGLGRYTAWNTDGSIYLDMEYDDRGSVALSRTYYDGGIKATEYGVGLPSLEWDKQGRLVALEYKHKNSAAKESYSVYVDLDPKSGRITSLYYEEGFEIKLSYREGGLFSDRKRIEALNSLKKSSQEMYDVVVKAANGEMNQSIDDLATSESQVRFSIVTDKKLLNELENGDTIKVYRAMQLQDGKLYPPMSGKVEGEWRNPIELGVWEQADEAPDKAVERKGKDGKVKYVFKLDKGNKKSLYAAYNPYIHTSRTPLNDQFSEAQDRPELVTVEVEIPTSELTSGYKAEKAKDAVGELEWKAGVVQGQLTGTRKVILSRYDKPIRIVPDAEVAERIVEMIDGRDIVFPSNVVTPLLREELEKRGVQFKETDNQGKPRFSITAAEDKAYADAVARGDMATAQRMVIEAAKKAMPNTKIVDADGNPMIVYHDTNATELVNIETGENWNDLDWRAKDEWRNREDFDEYWEERPFNVFKNVRSRRSIEMPAFFFAVNQDEYHEYGDRTIAAFLNITNPAIDPTIKDAGKYDTAGEDAMNELIAQGHDGFVRTENGEWYEVNAFYPSQIKSAETVTYDDNGEIIPLSKRFNMENADIRFSISNNNQRIFISNAEKAVESIKQDKATPQQWKAMIEKQGGLKAGEDKWLGLSEWLDSKVAPMQEGETMGDAARRVAKNTITKQEILDYIAEHQIRIEEVEYAEGSPFEGDLTMEQEGNFNSFILEWEEIMTSEGVSEEEAFETMVDRYGEDFRMAFELDEGNEFTYIVDYDGSLSDAAQFFLGKDNSNQINDVRLQYTTKGLENKQEIALTVPTIESWNEGDDIHFGDAGGGRAIAWIRFGETEVQTPREVIDHVDELQFAYTNANGQKVYAPQGSKFSKDYAVYGKLANGEMGYVLFVRNNQLSAHPTLEAALEALNAHYEANPRQVTDYDKVLVIDEIQSKRHQEGREKGYATKKDRDIKKKIAELTNQQDAIFDAMRAREEGRAGTTNFTEEETAELKRLGEEIKQLQSELSANNGIIPDAPFDKNWHELAFKRMLRYAAENGFDKVAWTTGAQQAQRYNLGDEVDKIRTSEDFLDGTIKVDVDAKNTRGWTLYVTEDGTITNRGAHAQANNWAGKPLSDVVGKPMEEKILSNKNQTIEGEGLMVGGEGMKGFYDKMLPSFVSKYVKKWGAKVGEVTMPHLQEGYQTMHSVDITPEMKESVMEGQVMFSISAKEVATDIWNKYQYDGELESVRDVAEYAEEHMPKNAQTQALFDAIDAYRIEEEEDRMYYGMRGDLEPFEDAIMDEVERLMNATTQSKLTESEQLTFDALQDVAADAGLDVTVGVSQEEAIKKMSSIDTEIVELLWNSPLKVSVVSSEDGAKVLKNIETAKEKYKNEKINSKNIVSTLGKIIGSTKENGSQYARFETVNGQIITIRISDHNANVSNFDNNKEEEGISIVISRKPNNGITNDGTAHVIEFFYSDKKLNQAPGTPIADILQSLEQTLYSGEYKDTTGIAEVEEVNGIELLRNPINGTILGYAQGNRIVLTREGMNPETMVHEYTHIWAKAMQRKNRAGWENIKQIFRESPLWNDVVNDPNYQGLKTDDAICSEVLARYSGKYGAERLDEVAREMILEEQQSGSNLGAARVRALINRARTAIKSFWKWVGKNLFGITKFDSQEDVADRVLYDLLNATDLDAQNNKGAAEKSMERPSPEHVEAMKAWNAANPYPTFEYGQDVNEFGKRIEEWKNARDKYRRSLLSEAIKDVNDADPITEPLVALEKPQKRDDETTQEFAQRLKRYHDNMIDQKLAEEYNAEINRMASNMNKAKRAFMDAALPIEEWQKWLVERGAKIDGNSNAYQDTFLANGRVSDAAEGFKRDILKPLANKIANIIKSKKLDSIVLEWSNIDVPGTKRKINGTRLTVREILGVYCQAKDCEEAETNGLPDRGKEGFKKNLSGATYEDIINLVESRLTSTEIQDLWYYIRKATKFALEYDFASGRITEDTYVEFSKRDYYVPQRGWRERDESGLVEEYEPVGKRGHDPYNAALVKARGRQSLAADPFAYIMSIGNSSIISSENNKVKQKMLEFCLKNEEIGLKTGAFRVKKYWLMHEIDPNTGKIRKDENGNPIVNMSYTAPTEEQLAGDKKLKEQIKRIKKDIAKANKQIQAGVGPKIEVALGRSIARWESQIQDLEDQIVIAWTATNTNISQRTRDEKLQHEVQVLKDGQRYVIELQDEKVANAINKKFKQHQEAIFDMSSKMRNATRFMSAMLTQYNPEFALSNFARDFQVAVSTIAIEHPELLGSYLKNFAMSQRAVIAYAFNDKVRDRSKFIDNEMGRYLKEYLASGAPTGFSYMQDLKSLRQDFDKMINEGRFSKGVSAAAGMFSMLTEISETTTRFSAYVAARKNGWSINDAAYMSKELTTNFDRAGEKADSAWMSWFSFFRATINGNIKFFRAFKAFPIGYSIMAALYFAAGMANQWFAPDDPDKELYVGDFTRQTNFIFGKWRLPAAHFMRMYFSAGVNFTMWMQDTKSFGHAVYDSATLATGELLPSYLNIPGNFTTYDESLGRVVVEDLPTVARNVAPTTISPIVDVYANRNFMGSTINKVPFALNQENTKDILLAKDNTLPIYKAITEGLYTAVGGDLNSTYKLDDDTFAKQALDISGSSVEHIVEGYFTGGMDLLATTANMIYDATQGVEMTPDKIAFVRKFYNKYSTQNAYDREYFKLRGTITAYKQMIADYEKKENKAKIEMVLRSKQYQAYKDTYQLLERVEEPTAEDVKVLMEANKKWIRARRK